MPASRTLLLAAALVGMATPAHAVVGLFSAELLLAVSTTTTWTLSFLGLALAAILYFPLAAIFVGLESAAGEDGTGELSSSNAYVSLTQVYAVCMLLGHFMSVWRAWLFRFPKLAYLDFVRVSGYHMAGKTTPYHPAYPETLVVGGALVGVIGTFVVRFQHADSRWDFMDMRSLGWTTTILGFILFFAGCMWLLTDKGAMKGDTEASRGRWTVKYVVSMCVLLAVPMAYDYAIVESYIGRALLVILFYALVLALHFAYMLYLDDDPHFGINAQPDTNHALMFNVIEFYGRAFAYLAMATAHETAPNNQDWLLVLQILGFVLTAIVDIALWWSGYVYEYTDSSYTELEAATLLPLDARVAQALGAQLAETGVVPPPSSAGPGCPSPQVVVTTHIVNMPDMPNPVAVPAPASVGASPPLLVTDAGAVTRVFR